MKSIKFTYLLGCAKENRIDSIHQHLLLKNNLTKLTLAKIACLDYNYEENLLIGIMTKLYTLARKIQKSILQIRLNKN